MTDLAFDMRRVSELRGFAQAFCAAVFDKSVEVNGKEIRYYYDFDILYRVLNQRDELSLRDHVHSALLSLGRAGKMRLAAPHVAELIEKTGKWKAGTVKPAQVEKALVEQIERYGLRDSLGLLASELVESATAESLYSRLASEMPTLLFVLEDVSEGWRQRLGRMLHNDLLELEQPGSMRDLARTTEFNIILRAISRDETRSHSNIRDALALSTLGSRVRDEPTSSVRFCTGSERIKTGLLKGPAPLKRFLEHHDSTDGSGDLLPSTRSMLRGPMYYLIRWSVPDLAFPGDTATGEPTVKSLGSLEEASSALSSALDDSDLLLEEAAKLMIEDMPIALHLRNLETLAIMRTLGRASESVLPAAGDKSESSALSALRRTMAESSDPTIQELVRNLKDSAQLREEATRREADAFARQSYSVGSVIDYAGALIAKARPATRDVVSVRERPAVELGLARWQLEDEARLASKASSLVSELLEPDLPSRVVAALEIAEGVIEGFESERDAIAAALALWELGLNSELRRLVSARWGQHVTPISMRILALGAHIRGLGGPLEGWAAVRRHPTRQRHARDWLRDMKRIESAILDPSLPSDVTGLLGLGYVAYAAWVRTWDESIHTAGTSYAQRELDLLDQPVGPGSDAEWAYALNLVVLLARFNDPKEERSKLRALKNSELWSHRFGDTLALVALHSVFELMDKPPDQRPSGWEIRARRAMVFARQYLDDVAPTSSSRSPSLRLALSELTMQLEMEGVEIDR